MLDGSFSKLFLQFQLIAEQVNDLGVSTVTKSTDQNSNRNFSGPVYTHVENVVGICLILQPGTPVRDNGAAV